MNISLKACESIIFKIFDRNIKKNLTFALPLQKVCYKQLNFKELNIKF